MVARRPVAGWQLAAKSRLVRGEIGFDRRVPGRQKALVPLEPRYHRLAGDRCPGNAVHASLTHRRPPACVGP